MYKRNRELKVIVLDIRRSDAVDKRSLQIRHRGGCNESDIHTRLHIYAGTFLLIDSTHRLAHNMVGCNASVVAFQVRNFHAVLVGPVLIVRNSL